MGASMCGRWKFRQPCKLFGLRWSPVIAGRLWSADEMPFCAVSVQWLYSSLKMNKALKDSSVAVASYYIIHLSSTVGTADWRILLVIVCLFCSMLMASLDVVRSNLSPIANYLLHIYVVSTPYYSTSRPNSIDNKRQ